MWNRATNTWKKYQSPSPTGSPYGLVVDQNDDMWYAEFHGCSVVRFDPDTEKLTKFESPSAPCTIRRPGADSKGNIWYGVWNKGRIEMLDPKTGKVTVHQVPVEFAMPYDTWVDPDDIVWSSSDSYMIRLDTKTGAFSYYPTLQRTDQPKITITRDGAVWYPPRGFAGAGGTPASAAVLYPDKAKMKTFAAYYSPTDPNANGWKYKGPRAKVAGTHNDGGAEIKGFSSDNKDLGSAAE
jgi:streptogramin lyase